MDRRTLFTMQAGLLLFLGGVVLLAFRKQRRQRGDTGADWFAASYFCGALGLALQAQRGILPAFVSIVLGNGIFMLFSVLANVAVARTSRQPARLVLYLLALDVATVLNYAYFTYVQPNVMLRTVEAVFVTSVLNIALIFMLLRSRDPIIRPAMRLMAAFMGVHILANFIRITGAVHVHAADAWYSWFGVVAISGLALAFLWIEILRMQDALQRTAMTDVLTGLFNRRALELMAGRELQRVWSKQLPCSALMLDMDRFKQVNDTLGHAAGDTALRAVGKILGLTVRATDLATRLGGDEFFVLLPDADEAAAALVADRIREAIQDERLATMDGQPFRIGVSIGQFTTRKTGMTLDDLLHASDIALYREKQISRSQHRGDYVAFASAEVGGGAQVQPSSA